MCSNKYKENIGVEFTEGLQSGVKPLLQTQGSFVE